MDDERLRIIYRFLQDQPDLWHTFDCTYSDANIILIELFRVAHHLSAVEALRRQRWPLWARRVVRFPSRSQFNRRIKRAAIQAGIERVSAHFRAQLPRTNEKACDGKPLLVGGFSKDPDAKRGKAPGGWARGYKMHAIVDAGGAVEGWKITPLNAGEGPVARELVTEVDLGGSLLRGDGNYDSVALYEAVEQAGGRLLAPRRKPGTGLGSHRQHPHRLQSIEELEQAPEGRKAHDRHRIRVEQIFGRLTTVCFGLWGLPAHVRRLERVERWVRAKLALYHLHAATSNRRQRAA
jgi:hypothetical protein